MADKLIANIHATFGAYTQNIRPLIARIWNHAQSQDNIASLFEQVSDYLIVFEQGFEVNYYTLLKFSTDLDPLLTTFGNQYELLLKFVGIVFSLALADMTIDIDDYPVLEPLVKKMKDSKKHTDYCLDSLRIFMTGTHLQDIPLFVENNSCPTPQNPSTTVAPQDHSTIKAELDNSLPTSNIKAELYNGLPTSIIKAELDNSLPTSNIKAEFDNSLPTSNIKAELDNSLPTSNIKAELDNGLPTSNIKAELDNSLPTSNIKAEFDNSSLAPQSSTSPVLPQRPNTTIDIKAEIDMNSQPMEIETLYDPDMDTSNTRPDNETDSNYDPSDSDFSDFEDIEGDFLEARERAFGNIWKHIPPRKHIDPFG